MKLNPNQLEIDFMTPAKKSLSVREISCAVGISTSKIYAAITEGKIMGTDIGHIDSEREEWRVPLHNYLAWVRNEYPEKLLYRWPNREWLTVKRIADFFGCSQQTIHNHLKTGEFPHAENLGAGQQKSWRIPLHDLLAFVQRRSNSCVC